MSDSRTGGPFTRPRTAGSKLGSMLLRSISCRGRLGLLVVLISLACEGPSESKTQSVAEATVDAKAMAAVADDEFQVAARIEPVRDDEIETLPAVSAGPNAGGLAPELKAALNWALLEYRTAFVGRNLAKLESIWSMGAVERLLIKNAWSTCERIDLSLETTKMRVMGERAVVEFDQQLEFLCPNESRTSESTLTADLVQGDGGEWKISRITDRQTDPMAFASGPARLAEHEETPADDATMHRALETLSDYESALQRCDLVGLGRVWIMTDLEEQILQGLCFRRGALEVTISEPHVSLSSGSVSVEFTHDLVRNGNSGPQSTRSRLTALLVERDDGNWAIWKVRAAE